MNKTEQQNASPGERNKNQGSDACDKQNLEIVPYNCKGKQDFDMTWDLMDDYW